MEPDALPIWMLPLLVRPLVIVACAPQAWVRSKTVVLARVTADSVPPVVVPISVSAPLPVMVPPLMVPPRRCQGPVAAVRLNPAVLSITPVRLTVVLPDAYETRPAWVTVKVPPRLMVDDPVEMIAPAGALQAPPSVSVLLLTVSDDPAGVLQVPPLMVIAASDAVMIPVLLPAPVACRASWDPAAACSVPLLAQPVTLMFTWLPPARLEIVPWLVSVWVLIVRLPAATSQRIEV